MKFLTLLLVTFNAYANLLSDGHLRLSHCYHWLDQQSDQYLTHKYQYANDNEGSLTFYTTPGTSNGSVAGPGLYCAKTPVGSYSYGDRVVKINFVEDVVMWDSKRGGNHCGHGSYVIEQAECNNKSWDVKFYNGGGKGNTAWYVISNPNAIDSWSSNSDDLINDLEIAARNKPSFAEHAKKAIAAMRKERAELGLKTIYNQNSRISLLKVFNETPEKINEFPPIRIVERLIVQLDEVNDRAAANALISEKILNVLEDNTLSPSNIVSALSRETVKERFIDFIKKNHALLGKFKDLNLLTILASTKEQIFTSKYEDQILSSIFTDQNKTKLLAEISFIENEQLNDKLKNRFENELRIKTDDELDQSLLTTYTHLFNEYDKELIAELIMKVTQDQPLYIKYITGDYEEFYFSNDKKINQFICENLIPKDLNFQFSQLKIGHQFYSLQMVNYHNLCDKISEKERHINAAFEYKEKTKKAPLYSVSLYTDTNHLLFGNSAKEIKDQCIEQFDVLTNYGHNVRLYQHTEDLDQYQQFYIDGEIKREKYCEKVAEISIKEIDIQKNKSDLMNLNFGNIGKGKFKITGRFESSAGHFGFNFTVNGMEEVSSQCQDYLSRFSQTLDIKRTYVTVNNGEQEYLYNGSCEDLSKIIAPYIQFEKNKEITTQIGRAHV